MAGQKRQVSKQFYYDLALPSSPAALPSLLEVADPDHCTYGSDYPFASIGYLNKQPEKYPLTDSSCKAMERGNAEVLFPRLKPQ